MDTEILVPDYRVVFACEVQDVSKDPDLEYGLSYYVHANPIDISLEEARALLHERLSRMFKDQVGAAGMNSEEFLEGLPLVLMPTTAAFRDAVHSSGRNYIGHIAYGRGPLVWGYRGTHGELVPTLRVLGTAMLRSIARWEDYIESNTSNLTSAQRAQAFREIITGCFQQLLDPSLFRGYSDPELVIDSRENTSFHILFAPRTFGRKPDGQIESQDNVYVSLRSDGFLHFNLTEHQYEVFSALFPEFRKRFPKELLE